MTTTEDPSLARMEVDATTPIPVVPAPPPAAAEVPAPAAAEAGPDGPDEADTDAPRVLNRRSFDDVGSVFGSLAAAVAFTWIVYWRLLDFSGLVGYAVLTWLVFLGFLGGVTLMSNPLPVLKDRLASAVVQSGAALIGALILGVLWYVYRKGWDAYTKVNFYTHDMSGVRPTDPLTKGGILHAIVGTAEQIGIATAISLPLGIGTALFLTEVGGRLAQVVRTVVEAMTALPDILAGLFVYTFLIIELGWEKSGITVAVALAVTMVPIIARSAEVMLRVVPGGLREAGLALGATRWRVVRSVVLPTARANLVTSIILGIARIAGETAPLLIVSGATTYFNGDPMHERQNSLPMFVFEAIRAGDDVSEARAFGAAAVLLTLVLILFVTARLIARDRVARGRR